MHISRYIFPVWLIFTPIFFASAQIVISEIMYDLEGSDTDREWIEIQNIGSSQIDLSTWKFYEGTSNHGLTAFEGSAIISPGSFVIIADTPSKFKSDNPGFSGIIFDSSFSLSNEGEMLIMRNETLNDIDSVTYSSATGGAGNGASIQKVNGSWVSGAPTPGALNAASSPPAPTSSGSSTSEGTDAGANTGSPSSVEQSIFPDAGEDKIAIAGASTLFEGEALGMEKKPLLNARYVWNFGDGEMAEGKRVMHTYRHPGEYTLVLTVASGDRSVSDKALVTAIEASVSISSVAEGEDGYIEISNSSPYELDMSWWQIFNGNSSFILPENTLLSPKKSLKISNAVSKIISDENLSLLYPSGAIAYSYTGNVSSGVPASKTEDKKDTPKTESKPENIISPKSSNVAESFSGEEKQAASVALAFENQDNLDNSEDEKWYLALAGILITAAVGVFFVRSKSRSRTGFEIVE